MLSISTELQAQIQECLDDIFTVFGKPCRVQYPPNSEACGNCEFDPIGQKSSNYYLHGGPVPFPNQSICPCCDGAGFRAVQSVETITALIAWQPKSFWVPAPGIKVESGAIQIKCYLTDWPKLKRAESIVIQTGAEPFVTLKFRPAGSFSEPHQIVQNRYCVVTLERV